MAKFTVSTVFRAFDHTSKVASKMQRNVQRSIKGMASAGRFMGTALRGAIAVLATGAVAKGINDFANSGDEIAKTARMLGLGAEALQELRFAADREGISAENLTMAFRLMNKNIGDLKSNQGELYSRLKVTNPALAKQLRTVNSSEEGFTILIDAISKETDVTKRAALAQAAFGRSGQELIKLAVGGTKGLAALREEARRYGGVLSNEAAAAAERFQDSMTNLKAALTGLKNIGLTAVITQLQPMIQGFAEWISVNKELIGQNLQRVFGIIGDVFKEIGPIILRLLEKLLPALAKIVDTALPVFVQLIESLLPLLDPLLALLDPLLEIFIALTPAIIAIADMITTVLKPALEILRPILELLAIVLKPIVDLIAYVAKGVGGILSKPLGRLAGVLNGPQTAGSAAATGSAASQEFRSTVDVNLNNVPAGSKVKQTGAAPGFSLNLGYAFAQGAGGRW